MRFVINIIIYIFYFTIINFNCEAQIVLDIDDLPQIGDVQKISIVDSSDAVILNPGNAGANLIWDFSNLNICCSDTVLRWINPENTNDFSTFKDADIAMKTQCYYNHDWITHIITEVCNNNDYFIKDTTGLLFYGSDFPNSHFLSGYRNIFSLLKYGEIKINNSRIVIQKSNDTTFVTNIKDTIIADAWGKMITPNGSYNTIRILTKETVSDSIYANGTAVRINYMPNNYYYKWYTKNLGFPVLQINKGIMEIYSSQQVVRVADSKSVDLSTPNMDEKAIETIVFPNPSSNEVKINFKKHFQKINLIVFDIQGNEKYINNYNSNEDIIISKNDIGSGLFLYKIVFNNGFTSNGKFVIN